MSFKEPIHLSYCLTIPLCVDIFKNKLEIHTSMLFSFGLSKTYHFTYERPIKNTTFIFLLSHYHCNFYSPKRIYGNQQTKNKLKHSRDYKNPQFTSIELISFTKSVILKAGYTQILLCLHK